MVRKYIVGGYIYEIDTNDIIRHERISKGDNECVIKHKVSAFILGMDFDFTTSDIQYQAKKELTQDIIKQLKGGI